MSCSWYSELDELNIEDDFLRFKKFMEPQYKLVKFVTPKKKFKKLQKDCDEKLRKDCTIQVAYFSNDVRIDLWKNREQAESIARYINESSTNGVTNEARKKIFNTKDSYNKPNINEVCFNFSPTFSFNELIIRDLKKKIGTGFHTHLTMIFDEIHGHSVALGVSESNELYIFDPQQEIYIVEDDLQNIFKHIGCGSIAFLFEKPRHKRVRDPITLQIRRHKSSSPHRKKTRRSSPPQEIQLSPPEIQLPPPTFNIGVSSRQVRKSKGKSKKPKKGGLKKKYTVKRRK